MRIVHAVLPLVLVAGCAHEPKQAKTPASDPYAHSGGSSNGSANPTAAADTRGCTSDVDCGAKQLCVRSQCVDITSDLAECRQLGVHFAFNSALVDDDARSQLTRAARCLNADQALHVRVEGNADERGTDEYNLALGDQRATSVAKYLSNLGVSKKQLKTVSYGKEKPLCVEHDEDCWSKNRRADLVQARR